MLRAEALRPTCSRGAPGVPRRDLGEICERSWRSEIPPPTSYHPPTSYLLLPKTWSGGSGRRRSDRLALGVCQRRLGKIWERSGRDLGNLGEIWERSSSLRWSLSLSLSSSLSLNLHLGLSLHLAKVSHSPVDL